MASDADIESFTSEEISSSRLLYSSPIQVIRFLVFDCDEGNGYVTPGRIVPQPTLSRTPEQVQRDLILKYNQLNKPYLLVINSDQYKTIFGDNHKDFLMNYHSILVILPCERSEQTTFFISKDFSNTPVYVSQIAPILESPVTFCCISLPKPISLHNLQFVKQQLTEDPILFCCGLENAETSSKVTHFNQSECQAFYLSVVKCKTNILKFSFHQSCQVSTTIHVEYHSTNTVSEVLKSYVRVAKKKIPEFSDKEVTDISVTDDKGNSIDSNLNAIICLVFNEKSLLKDYFLDHSYPTLLVHLTPKPHKYSKLKVRILGDDRGHMHPFTVFINKECSPQDLKLEIAKHCHWNPKSFIVCFPNSSSNIEDVNSNEYLQFISQANSNSIFTVQKVPKVVISIKSTYEQLKSFILQEYPLCSVEDLKNTISKRLDILPKEFDLMYKNTILEDAVLLASLSEKQTSLDLIYNKDRIIFKVYIHKSIENRSEVSCGNFLHIRIESLDDLVGEIITSIAEKIKVEEDNLYMINSGRYVEKQETYRSLNITDGTTLCLCLSSNEIETGGSDGVCTVFQVKASEHGGEILKVTEKSIEALQRQLKKLQLKEGRKKPTFKIMSQGKHKASDFKRMISVPNDKSKSLLAARGPVVDGYKSDTDLLKPHGQVGPKPSPSDSQICNHMTDHDHRTDQRLKHCPSDSVISSHSQTQQQSSITSTPKNLHASPLPKLNISAASSTDGQTAQYYVETPPLSPRTNTPTYGPPGFSINVNINANSLILGNLPDLKSIFPGPKSGEFDNAKDRKWNQIFLKVAKEIINDWKTIARYLEIGEKNINIIDENIPKVEDKTFSMLSKWREIKGQAASKERLIQALEDGELKRVAEMVMEFEWEEEEENREAGEDNEEGS